MPTYWSIPLLTWRRVLETLGGGGAPYLKVIANSAEAAALAAGVPYAGTHPVGSQLPIQSSAGTTFVSIRDVQPAEFLVLTNRP